MGRAEARPSESGEIGPPKNLASDKKRIFGDFLRSTCFIMAEPALPQKPETTPRLQNEGAKRDSAPNHPPARTPAVPPRRSPPPMVGPGPRAESPIAPRLLPRPQTPEDFGDVPVRPSPKKETARLTILPRPFPPPATVQLAPGTVATSRAMEAFDSIPRWVCWGLLGLSALIFLTQIWNYALS